MDLFSVAANSYRGTSFVTGFMTDNNGSPTLYLVASQTATVNIQIPFSSINDQVVVQSSSVQVKSYGTEILASTSDVIANKGVYVTSDVPILLYIGNMRTGSSDATFVLPLASLGHGYMVIGHDSTNAGTEAFVVIATRAGTTVTIKPPNQGPSTYVLNYLDTYYRTGTGLSGTLVNATAPISVISGHICANIPDNSVVYCDYIDEILPPAHSYGKVFVFGYMYGRQDFTIGIVAGNNYTIVDIYDDFGMLYETVNMSHGDHIFRTFYQAFTGSVISNEPILVTQYSHGSNLVFGDPAMMVVPALSNYGPKFEFNVLSGFTSSMGVVVPDGQASGLLLDGNAFIPASSVTVDVPWVGLYTLVYLDIGAGYHTLAHTDLTVKMAAWAYGRTTNEEYAFCLGMMT